jgi:hypothetical protein
MELLLIHFHPTEYLDQPRSLFVWLVAGAILF